MHSGGSVQRAATGSPSSQQGKSISDSAQSSVHSASAKTKKRERTDHHTSQSKQDCSSQIEDSESSPPKRERIAKLDDITTKVNKDGGLSDLICVDQLILLMQQEQHDGPTNVFDIISRRHSLIGVITATEKEDLRKHFIQSGGLLILDDWLHEGHKGKAGDGSCREVEKGIEELTLVILIALDKLPIDLEALKACSIGKAVNHLRCHKNQEIQKRARKLVDTWRKRVDLEMKCKGEMSGLSNQGMSCCQKESSSDPVHHYPGKMENSDDAKSSATSNNILKPGSSDSTLTSVAITSCTSHNSGSPLTENAIRIQLSGTAMCLPIKEEKNINICPCLPSFHSSREDDSNAAADKSGTSSYSSESLKKKNLVGGSLAESQKVIPAGASLVLGSNTKDSNSCVCEKELNDFAHVERSNDHRKVMGVFGSNSNLVCSVDTGPKTDAAQLNVNSLQGEIDRYASLPLVDEESGNVANVGKNFGVGTTTGLKNDIACKQTRTTHANGNASAGKVTDMERRIENFDHMVSQTEVIAKVVNNSSYENGCAVDTQQKAISEGLVKTEAGESMDKVETSSTNRQTVLSGVGTNIVSTKHGVFASDEHLESTRHTNKITMQEEKRVECLTQSVQLYHAEVQGMLQISEAELQNACEPHNHLHSDTDSGIRRHTCFEGDRNQHPSCLDSGVCTSPKDNHLRERVLHALDSSTVEGCSTEDHGCNSHFQEFSSTSFGCSEASSMERHKSGNVKCETGTKNEMRTEKSPGTLQTLCSETLDFDREKVAEPSSQFPREDALEEAGKVAKEVEKDLEFYGNTCCSASADKQAEIVEFKILEDHARNMGGNKCDRGVKNADKCEEGEGALPTSTESQDAVREDKEERNTTSYNNSNRNNESFRLLSPNIVAGRSRKFEEISIDMNQSSEDSLKVAKLSRVGETVMDLVTESSPSFEFSSVLTHANDSSTIETPRIRLTTGHLTSQVHDFDLNQGLSVDETPGDSGVFCVSASIASSSVTSIVLPCTVPRNHSLTAPVAVVTATKGGFILPVSSSHNRSEIGWKGSAATSAFRPAEPRRMSERTEFNSYTTISNCATDEAKPVRTVLDFDLNIADDGMLEHDKGMSLLDPRNGNQPTSLLNNGKTDSSNACLPAPKHKLEKPDFDLNCVDDGDENKEPVSSDSRYAAVDVSLEGSLKNIKRPVMLEIDLNDGPFLEEAVNEPVQQDSNVQNSDVTTPAAVVGPRLSGMTGDYAAWSSNGSLYPGVTISGLNRTRSESSFPVTSAHSVSVSRQTVGTTISPSSAVIYPAAPAFLGCASFPFPAKISYNSGSFSGPSPYTITTRGTGTAPGVPSQTAAARAVVPVVRPPFIMNFTELGKPGSLYTWGRSDLDLNAGVGLSNINCRELGNNTKESSIYHGGVLTLEEQMRFLQQGGVSRTSLKRKEPEGDWEQSRPGFRQATWQ